MNCKGLEIRWNYSAFFPFPGTFFPWLSFKCQLWDRQNPTPPYYISYHALSQGLRTHCQPPQPAICRCLLLNSQKPNPTQSSQIQPTLPSCAKDFDLLSMLLEGWKLKGEWCPSGHDSHLWLGGSIITDTHPLKGSIKQFFSQRMPKFSWVQCICQITNIPPFTQ